MVPSPSSGSLNVVPPIFIQTFAEVDADKDGKIGKDEWKIFVVKHPSILKNMTLPYLK